MGLSPSTAVFLASLCGLPIAYLMNTLHSWLDEKLVFGVGVATLSLVVFFTYLLCENKRRLNDPLFFVFSICCFSSVIDLFIGLENDDIISGFVGFYLKDGEPYLKSAYGTMVCYWDGTGHYAMYLIMLYAISWNQDFRKCGLYWVGSIAHSLFVLLPGSVIGKYGVKWSFLLNCPYVIVPIYALTRFLRERPRKAISVKQSAREHTPIWRRPFDTLLIIYLTWALILAFFRGFTVLGCNQWYIKDIEPYLNDPVAYPMLQMLVYLFYFVPYYCVAIYGLIVPGCNWMPDWALLHAGAAIQAQVSHIGGAINEHTPYIYRTHISLQSLGPFLAVNLPLLIIPQIMAARCIRNYDFFMPVAEGGEKAVKRDRESKKIQ